MNSGIQESHGGVARYHHSDTRRNARASTEITGYTIGALLFLYDRSKDPDLLEAAVNAGRFLTEAAWSPSLKTFPFEYASDGDAPQPLTYFFDCGIITRALIALHRATGDPVFLSTAVQAGESMARDFATGHTWHPILELPGKYPLQWTSQWSRRPGCYQLKAAMAWQDLYAVTGETRFARLYQSAVTTALATKDEFLPAETREKTMDRLHAFCYFLEGLSPVMKEPEARAAISKGITHVSRYLREIRADFDRSDVYAQLLRVRLLADCVAALPLNVAEAEEEAAIIQGFQIDEAGAYGEGGFWFGRKSGETLPFINPVSTAFCVQAHEWWQDYQAGRPIAQAII